MNTLYCSCGSKNLYAGAKPKFCASCGQPFEKVAASLVKISVPQETTAPYGYCPACGSPGLTRERRLNGYDMCENGHQYLSAKAKDMPGKHVAVSELVEETEEPLNLKFDIKAESNPMMTVGSYREANGGGDGGADVFKRGGEGEMSEARAEAQKIMMQEVASRPVVAAPAPAKRGRPRKK